MKSLHLPWRVLSLILIPMMAFLTLFIVLYFRSGPLQINISLYDTITFVVCLVVFVVWGVSLLYRMQEKKIRVIFVWMLLICLLWIFSALLKRLTQEEWLERYAWYFSYGPMLFLPSLWVVLVIVCVTNIDFRKILVFEDTVSALFFGLMMTNDLHHWAFAPDEARRPLYFVIYGWVFINIFFSALLFIIRIPKRSGIKACLPAFVMVLLSFAYSICYLLILRKLPNIIKNYYFMYVLLAFGTIEAAVDGGLLQNTGSYLRFFEEGSYRMALVDPIYRPLFVNQNFTMVKEIEAVNPVTVNGFRYKKNAIPGGYFIVQEDIREVLRLQNELLKKKAELTAATELLKKRQIAEPEIEKATLRDELIQKVYLEIERENDYVGMLAFSLPDALIEETRPQYISTLSELKLRLCFLKQRCLLLISASPTGLVPYDVFALSAGSLTQDLKASGFDVAFLFAEKQNGSLSYFLLVNEALREIVQRFGPKRGSIFLTIKPVTGLLKIRIAAIEGLSFEKLDLKPTITKEDDDYLLSFGESK
jgi:hypothetical protein